MIQPQLSAGGSSRAVSYDRFQHTAGLNTLPYTPQSNRLRPGDTLQVFGALDLSDAAHGHQLRAVEGVTANVQPKKWSLAGELSEPACLPAGSTPGAGSSHTRLLRAWDPVSQQWHVRQEAVAMCAAPGSCGRLTPRCYCTCVLLYVYVCVCRPD